jgi:hypothetical protein
MKTLTLKHPLPEVSNDEAYNHFVEHVATKVHELDDKREKIYMVSYPLNKRILLNPLLKLRLI